MPHLVTKDEDEDEDKDEDEDDEEEEDDDDDDDWDAGGKSKLSVFSDSAGFLSGGARCSSV